MRRGGEFAVILKHAVAGWIDDRASSMGAAIAYYTAFSLAPLLLIVIAVAGLAFGEAAARGAILDEIGGLIGPRGAEAVQAVLAGAHSRSGGVFSTMVGIITLIIGATTVFSELQSDLDRIWKVPVSSGGIVRTIQARLLSFGLVIGMGFLLIVSLVVSAAISALGRLGQGSFPGEESVLQVINTALSFGVITVIFAMIYKLLPRARVRWREVWPGGAFTAGLFSIGKFVIGLYIGKAALASSFGAAGTFVVLLAWIYYSAQIFLFGAEVTYHHAQFLRQRAPAGKRIGAAS
jgi:membrane protein